MLISKNKKQHAFALPSILIASIVLLIVLAAGMSSVATTRVALDDQHYNELAEEAAISGTEFIKACLVTHSYEDMHGYFKPDSKSCVDSDIDTGKSHYVLDKQDTKSTYVTSVTGTTGDDFSIESVGITRRFRKSNNSVWKEYKQSNNVMAHALEKNAVTGVSASTYHTCALASNNDAYCWGHNTNGRVGDGTTVDRKKPTRVMLPSGSIYKKLTTGFQHSCALSEDGDVYCWGSNLYGRIGDGTDEIRKTPVKVSPPSGASNVDYIDIASGGNHSCAIASNHEAYCWGHMSPGLLGDGNQAYAARTIPSKVSTPNGVSFKQIAAGFYSSCGVATNGRVYCWGSNKYGGLGTGNTTRYFTPRQTYYNISFESVSTEGLHACGLTGAGYAYCWGYNNYGQLGIGNYANRTYQVAVAGGHKFIDISAGFYHTCALESNGKAYCWGSNSDGQIGDGTQTKRPLPTLVNSPSGVKFTGISAGYYRTCALSDDNSVWCWGHNEYGGVGGGGDIRDLNPVKVEDSAFILTKGSTYTYY